MEGHVGMERAISPQAVVDYRRYSPHCCLGKTLFKAYIWNLFRAQVYHRLPKLSDAILSVVNGTYQRLNSGRYINNILFRKSIDLPYC